MEGVHFHNHLPFSPESTPSSLLACFSFSLSASFRDVLFVSVLGRYSLYVHLSEETITLLLYFKCLGMNSQLKIVFLWRLKALLWPHPLVRAAVGMSSNHLIFLILFFSWAWLSSWEVLSSLLSMTIYLGVVWVFCLVSKGVYCDKICCGNLGKLLIHFYQFFLLFNRYENT